MPSLFCLCVLMEVSGLFSVDGCLRLNKVEVKSSLLDPGQNKNRLFIRQTVKWTDRLEAKV